MSVEKIQAVHSQDIQGYLASLGVWDELVAGQHHCQCCDKVITLANLAMIVPREGQIVFVCDDAKCVEAAMEHRSAQHE